LTARCNAGYHCNLKYPSLRIKATARPTSVTPDEDGVVNVKEILPVCPLKISYCGLLFGFGMVVSKPDSIQLIKPTPLPLLG